MKNLTQSEYNELHKREQNGEKLSEEERLGMLLYLGYAEDTARQMLYIDSDEYKNQPGPAKIII